MIRVWPTLGVTPHSSEQHRQIILSEYQDVRRFCSPVASLLVLSSYEPIFLMTFFCRRCFLISFAFFLSFSNGGVSRGPLRRGILLDTAPAGRGKWSVLMMPPSAGRLWSVLVTPPSTGLLKGAPRGLRSGLGCGLMTPGLLVVRARAWLSM